MKYKYKHLRDILSPMIEEHPSKYWDILSAFLDAAELVAKSKDVDLAKYEAVVEQYAKVVLYYMKKPPHFESLHVALRSPIDCYLLSIDFFRPLVDIKNSTLIGIDNLQEIEEYIAKGENVVFFANHQIEADPTMISLLLEDKFPKLAEDLFCIAGQRVVSDPLAIPHSIGRNLFCIYSKKYFEAHAEKKVEMLSHNNQTIQSIVQQFKLGGKCVYIAPSGGRDRPNEKGEVEVAKFDPQSIELLYLLGKKSKKPTHFFPLALSTHSILPPPEELQIDLGESRSTKEAPIHIHFGKEIDMENFPKFGTTDKEKKKLARANSIWNIVCDMYRQFPN